MKKLLLFPLLVLPLLFGFLVARLAAHDAYAQGAADAADAADAGAAPPGPTVEVSDTAVVVAETHLDPGTRPAVAPPTEPVTTTTTVTTTTSPPTDPVDTVRDVVAGVRTGNWRMAGGALVALLMLGLKTARDKTRWFSGDRGGALLVLLLSFLGSLGAALGTDLPVDLRMLMGALGVAVTAAGGYSVVKGLFFSADPTDRARSMFNAYNEQGGWKTFDGRPVPPWEDLGDDVRGRWVAAARAA